MPKHLECGKCQNHNPDIPQLNQEDSPDRDEWKIHDHQRYLSVFFLYFGKLAPEGSCLHDSRTVSHSGHFFVVSGIGTENPLFLIHPAENRPCSTSG